jgi:ketosteroid isomerase-like protein
VPAPSKKAVEEVSSVLQRINRSWLEGRTEELEPLFHDDVVMTHPGFSGKSEGKAAMLAGFEDFCKTASVESFDVRDRSVDVIGDVGVATFQFEIVYEREGKRYHSTGRDFWVFGRSGGAWQAVFRTMLDTREETAS